MKRRMKSTLLILVGLLAALALLTGTALAEEQAAAPQPGVEAPAHAAEAGGHGGGHTGVPEKQLWDLLWRAMNFAVLVGLLIFLLKKPLGAAMAGRTDNIKKELDELEARRDEAKRELAVMEQRLRDAKGEREKVLDDFRAQGEREKEKIVLAAQSLSERIKAQAQFTIEQETSMAKAELQREIAEMSAAVAEDLLREKINQEDQTRLVDEYLSKVEQEVQ